MSITTAASRTETGQTNENFLFHLTMPGVIPDKSIPILVTICPNEGAFIQIINV